MFETVISTEGIRANIVKCLQDSGRNLTKSEIEIVCDAYLRYYVLRVDPTALGIVCAEVVRQ